MTGWRDPSAVGRDKRHAMEMGWKRYWGNPCPACRGRIRYVHRDNCVECSRQAQAKFRQDRRNSRGWGRGRL
jgi:hypothetical protein